VIWTQPISFESGTKSELPTQQQACSRECDDNAVAAITLEHVPPELLPRLTRRAEHLGLSLNDYLLRLCAVAAEPELPADALRCLEGLPPYPTARIISPWTDPV
jgi:hypothetical protein